MIHKTKVFLLFLLLFTYLKSEQIWLVKFSSKHNYLSNIEKSFPLIDLLQYDYYQALYIFLVPKDYLTNFIDFIHRSNGTYRIIVDNIKDTFQIRLKTNNTIK